ncbi:MAG: MBL fold metallo-hydrolase [Oscillospiraceae bacterium]|nr:MBL fold metallo-hydrolase [Oscillospiraceae bacterium]
MLTCHSLFSGSSGNSIYIKTEYGRFLIDAGGSMRRISEALRLFDDSPSELSAIFITHEHGDHTKALGQLCKRTAVPIYATEPVARAIYDQLLPRPDEARAFAESVLTIRPDSRYEICGLEVEPFSTPHDSVGSVGFVFGEGASEKLLGVATDIGCITQTIRSSLYGCRAVVIESNHDIDMLKSGSYPQFLKERILSDHGHLSNVECAKLCTELVAGGTDKITLFHLSDENNTPEKAYRSTSSALKAFCAAESDGISLNIASRYAATDILSANNTLQNFSFTSGHINNKLR